MHDETQQGVRLEKEGVLNLSVATDTRVGQTPLLTTNLIRQQNVLFPLIADDPCVGGNESDVFCCFRVPLNFKALMYLRQGLSIVN